MTAVLVSIAMTTGACAFMFFVLPFMDARKAKANPPAPRADANQQDDANESAG